MNRLDDIATKEDIKDFGEQFGTNPSIKKNDKSLNILRH